MVRFEVYFEERSNRIVNGLELRSKREKEIKGDLKFFDLSSWKYCGYPDQTQENCSVSWFAEEEEMFNFGHTEFSVSVRPVEMMSMLLNMPLWNLTSVLGHKYK